LEAWVWPERPSVLHTDRCTSRCTFMVQHYNFKISIINNETIQKNISGYIYHRECYTAGRTWSAIASLVVWIGLWVFHLTGCTQMQWAGQSLSGSVVEVPPVALAVNRREAMISTPNLDEERLMYICIIA